MTMTTIKRIITILILLAVIFFIYHAINPIGANKLLDTTRNFFGISTTGSVASGMNDILSTGQLAITGEVEITGISLDDSSLMKNLLANMGLVGSGDKIFSWEKVTTGTVENTGGSLTIVTNTGISPTGSVAPKPTPTATPTLTKPPTVKTTTTKPTTKPVTSSPIKGLSRQDYLDTEALLHNLFK